MGEEKRNKIVAAITVNAILLIFIILAVLIAQIVQISVLKRRKATLISQLKEYYETLESGENLWDKLQNDEQFRNVVTQLYQMGYTEDDIKRMLLGDDYDKYNELVLAVVIE